MALQLSLKRLLAKLCLNPFFSVHLLQAGVFSLQLFQALHQRSIHTAVFGTPLINQRRAYTVLARQVGDRNTRLMLLQDRQNLAVGES